MKLTNLLTKILPKATREKLLCYLNFSLAISLDEHLKIKIPILGGIGSVNRLYRRDWMVSVLSKLINLKGGVFLDIGVNLGQSLIAFKATKCNRKYIGFEPNSMCVNYVLKLIAINNLENCLIIPIGLSNKNSLVKLYYPRGSNIDPNATILEDLRPERDLESFIIPCFKLDEIFNLLDIENISTIKIDIEGAELEALQGMLAIIKRDRPFIICEILFRDSKFSPTAKQERDARLFNFLYENQYVILQLLKTSDLQQIQNIDRIEEFSQVIWNEENKNLCDYLLVPAESEEIVIQQFIS